MNSKSPAFPLASSWLPPAVWAEISRFSAMLMEVILYSSWFELAAKPPVSFGVILAFFSAVIISSHFIPRYFAAHPWDPNRKRWFFVGWSIFVVLVALKLLAYPNQAIDIGGLIASPVDAFIRAGGNLLEIWIVVFILITATRGMTIGTAFASNTQLYTQFTLTSIFMMVYTFVAGFDKPVQVIGMITAYFFFALLSLASSRIVNSKTSFGPRSPDYDLRWSSGILVYLLLLGSSGFFIGGIVFVFIPWFIELIYPFLRIFILAIGILLGILLDLVVKLLQNVVQVLANTGIFKNASDFLKRIEEFSQQTQTWQNENMQNMGTPFNLLLFIIFILVILIIFFIIVTRRLTRLRKIRLQQGKDANINLENPPTAIANKSSRRKLRGAARSQAALRIRQTYSDLMQLFEKLNAPRPEAYTPLEFLPKMIIVLPERSHDLELITRAYQDIRYGELPETEDEVTEILAAWKRIQVDGRFAAKKPH
jgi:hypothetical protein